GQQVFHAAMRTAAASFLQLLPAHRRASGCHLGHGDAAGHGADQCAQVAAYALVFQNMRDMFCQYPVPQVAVGSFLHADALVRAIFACDVAEIAANALFGIDLGHDLVVQIEVAPVVHARHRLTHDVHDGAEALFFEIIFEAFDHVANDTEAVVHGRSADLDGGGSQQHELYSVAPVADAADAGDRDIHGVSHRRDHVQRNWLNSRTTVAAMAAASSDSGPRSEGVEVDAHQTVEGVNQGDGVGVAGLGGTGHVSNVSHI